MGGEGERAESPIQQCLMPAFSLSLSFLLPSFLNPTTSPCSPCQVDQIERSLPADSVLDCIVPQSEARALGVLYLTPSTGQYSACLWREGQLMGGMAAGSREESRR